MPSYKKDLSFVSLFLILIPTQYTIFLWLRGLSLGYSEVISWCAYNSANAPPALSGWIYGLFFFLLVPTVCCALSGGLTFFYFGKKRIKSAVISLVSLFCLYFIWQYTVALSFVVQITYL